MSYLQHLNNAYEALQAAFDATPEGRAFDDDRNTLQQAMSLLEDPIATQEAIERRDREENLSR